MNKSDTVEAEGTKLEHSFTNYAYNDDATCKNDGTETAFCDREGCSGSDTRAATGTRLEHDYVKTIKEPTCTEEGCVFNQCRGVNCVCNDWYKSETIAATGHSGGTASCAKKAVCKVCGMEYGDFAKHEYDTENFVPAGEAGHFYMCINCPAHTRAEPHVPGPEATELSPQVCLACGYIIKPALMHRHRPTKVPAKPSTCTEPGNIEYYICSCGHYFLDINCITEVVIISNLELAPKGHSFTKYKSDKNATCEKDGTETAKCDNCHETNTRTEENSQLPHQYKEEVIKPTCTEGGYTVFTCKNCGYSYTGDETECLGHSYEAVVIDPECTSCGYTIHTCIRCREEYRDSETPAIGHEWSEATCTEPEKCSRCGMEDGLPKGHELSEWQSNPGKHWKFCTREECGRKISETEGKHSDADYDGICDICGYHYPEIYSVIGGQNAVLENVSIQTFTFRANGDFEKFTNLKIDGRTVMRDFYTAYSGSTVICFASEYLKTLSLGKHKIEFIYTDGIAVSDFAIKSIGPPPKKINTAPVTSTIIITPAEAAPETSESEELNPQTGAPTP